MAASISKEGCWVGHVASESPLWRTQQVTKAQRGGRMSSSTAYSGSLSAPHLASVELPGGLAEPCPLSGPTSSGVSVNGSPSSGGLHFEGQLKTRGGLAKVSHKSTTVGNLASEWNWLLLSLDTSGARVSLHRTCFPHSYSGSSSVAVALLQHLSSCPLSAWMLGGEKTMRGTTALQLPKDTRCWVSVS